MDPDDLEKKDLEDLEKETYLDLVDLEKEED